MDKDIDLYSTTAQDTLMSTTALTFFLLLGLAAGAWAHNARISRRAIQFAAQSCHRQGLQLLDQSVLLESVRLSTYRGMPSLIRRYRFEFSAKGDRRYLGWVTLNAWRLTATEMQPFADKPQLDPLRHQG